MPRSSKGGAADTGDYVQCGVTPPRDGLESCPLEEGHDGEHIFYFQTPWGDGSRTYGLNIYNEALECEWNMEIDGAMEPIEIAASLAILKAARKGKT